MPLESGSRLGNYTVDALIGEGGMGQVYSATDTKLNRQVALKILPEAFASDPDRLARFQREAQVLASLNHPGIAAIYGLEEAADTRALVLELVEGPTLADRIAKGPIPLDEALPIAKQIAEALEAAHEAGVIHRDLKPANIKVRDDGTVKVLDFGLAKALDPTPEGDPSQSPTLTAAATQMGVIMGTAAYMSPEQARGKPVDKRADIWAFGAVVYEMLTGRRAFAGDDVSETLARVIEREVDWDELPPISPSLETYLRRCIRKDPRQRVRDIGDMRLALDGAFETAVHRIPQKPRSVSVLFGVAASIAVTAVVVWVIARESPPGAGEATRFQVSLPADVSLTDPSRGSVAVSPDGRHIVFVASRGAGLPSLYHRAMHELTATPIPGTEGAREPFFSPGGGAVGFLASDRQTLRQVGLDGLPPVTITTAPGEVQALTWAPDDTIVFVSRGTAGLWRVPSEGGTPERVVPTPHEDDNIVNLGTVLQGASAALVTVGDLSSEQVGLYDFTTGDIHRLLPGTSPHYASSGHIVFSRDGDLWAVPFTPGDVEITASETRVVTGVSGGLDSQTRFALSESGVLVYLASGGYAAVPVWVDRNGREDSLGLDPAAFANPRVSSSGTRLATHLPDQSGSEQIWVFDLIRGTRTRVTNPPGSFNFPLWAPDDERVVFQRLDGERGLYWKRADGLGEMELLLRTEVAGPFSWTSDGSTLLYATANPDTGWDILALPLGDEQEPIPVLQTPANEFRPAVSPDGQWMAYYADDSGELEVYVRPFPNVEDERVQISTGGGVSPLWGPAGDELFYRRATAVLRVPIETTPEFSVGIPEVVAEGMYLPDGTAVPRLGRTHDLSPDGRRIFMLKPADPDAVTGQVVVVQDWFAELQRLVPEP